LDKVGDQAKVLYERVRAGGILSDGKIRANKAIAEFAR